MYSKRMIVLTKHIAREMANRRITLDFIERAIATPQRCTPDPNDSALTRSYKTIPEFGDRVLRVVHRPEGDNIKIVTVHWDRGAKL